MNNTYCGQHMRTRVVSYQTIVEPTPLHDECMVQLNDTNVMISLKASGIMYSGGGSGSRDGGSPRATASTGEYTLIS